MTDQEKMKIIENALNTLEGRQSLRDAMVEPLRTSIEYPQEERDYAWFMDKVRDRLGEK